MRYYSLTISDPATGKVWRPTVNGLGLSLQTGGSTFTSYVNGQTITSALNIEFDIPVYPFATPQGSSMIRVWGIGLTTIGQGIQLGGTNITLSAGMKAGFPLANPAQSGVIVQGNVFQAYGNWQGVEQTLDLVMNPGALGVGQNIAFSWTVGQSLESALLATFNQAYPGYGVSINISNNLIAHSSVTAYYPSSAAFASAILALSQKIGRQIYGDTYPGVNISIRGNTISAFDGRGATAPQVKLLAFTDLIGQPTWIGVATVNFKTVMRSDISVGDTIKFPTGILAPYALMTPDAAYLNAPARSRTIFQQSFMVIEVHHFGNFRDPDAESWVTAFSAVAI
jgi:hypothetical protein